VRALCFVVPSFYPNKILVRLTSPSLPWMTYETVPSLHSFVVEWSASSTISPTCRFLLVLSQHCLVVMLWRYSFFHLLQNLSVKYCTWRHLSLPKKILSASVCVNTAHPKQQKAVKVNRGVCAPCVFPRLSMNVTWLCVALSLWWLLLLWAEWPGCTH